MPIGVKKNSPLYRLLPCASMLPATIVAFASRASDVKRPINPGSTFKPLRGMAMTVSGHTISAGFDAMAWRVMVTYVATALSSDPGTHLSDCAMLPCTAATRTVGGGSVRAGHAIHAAVHTATMVAATTAALRQVRRTIASARYAPAMHTIKVTPFAPM